MHRRSPTPCKLVGSCQCRRGNRHPRQCLQAVDSVEAENRPASGWRPSNWTSRPSSLSISDNMGCNTVDFVIHGMESVVNDSKGIFKSPKVRLNSCHQSQDVIDGIENTVHAFASTTGPRRWPAPSVHSVQIRKRSVQRVGSGTKSLRQNAVASCIIGDWNMVCLERGCLL